MEYKQIIRYFEQDTGNSVIYLTLTGSKLFGTDNVYSDTDIKGLFIPSNNNIHSEKVFTFNSNKNKKNSSEDFDLTLYSIDYFFQNLVKAEEGAIDILFSMFSSHNILFENKEKIDLIRESYYIFISKNIKNFLGCSIGQTKKFGIKAKRYGELDTFFKYYKTNFLHKREKIQQQLEDLKLYIEKNKFEYIKIIKDFGHKMDGKNKKIFYISILDKKFSEDSYNDYFISRIEKLYNQFGDRTKKVFQTDSKTDFKALSHSYRGIIETKELILEGKITFPLKEAKYVKEIKEGKHNPEVIFEQTTNLLEETLLLLSLSDLPKEPDILFVEDLLLNINN